MNPSADSPKYPNGPECSALYPSLFRRTSQTPHATAVRLTTATRFAIDTRRVCAFCGPWLVEGRPPPAGTTHDNAFSMPCQAGRIA